MKKKTVVTKLPAGEIVETRKLDDGTYEIIQEVPKFPGVSEEKIESCRRRCSSKNDDDSVFILIEAEKLSYDDTFMQYDPQTENERLTKQLIAKAIETGVKNFYKAKRDPIYWMYDIISFEIEGVPCNGASYDWWKEIAREYNPQRNSRLGTVLQYEAFLGVLIKKLVEEGKSIEWAWNAVCNDSLELGDFYSNSDSMSIFPMLDHTRKNIFIDKHRQTGTKPICGFCDLAVSEKILATDPVSQKILAPGAVSKKILSRDKGDVAYWLASAHFNQYSREYPIAQLKGVQHPILVNWTSLAVGWIVMD